MPHHVSRESFGRLVEEALSGLPPRFAAFLAAVPVQVRDRPSVRQLRDLGMDDDELLLGLYVGRPMTERSVLDGPAGPDVIYVFQEDVEQVSGDRADLIEQVRVTVLHEIGHHFGMSEDDLDALGYG